jgi:putative endonuclease
MATHNDLGRLGESLAVDYLLKNNYVILERNWRFQKAEIDIIAKKEGQIIIVEVKTRNSNFFGDPQSFVSPEKIKLLVKAANQYLVSNNIPLEVRFDILAIIKNKSTQEITHFKDAFYYF